MHTEGNDAPSVEGPDDVFKLVGVELVGRFRVDAVVAEGGFGVVYRGVQLGLDRPVAIKVLKTPEDARNAKRFLETFREEARTIAKLRHPAIVQVLDFGTTAMPSGAEAPFMVLEWIDGDHLEKVLEARAGSGGRAPAECLDLLRPVFEAVDVAHQAGVAHRDLKPQNIMVVPTPRGPVLRLLDFGIAKVMDREAAAPVTGVTRTASGVTLFSPRYAAPEQVSGARTGPWTDVHALALMLVEALTDQSAYQADDVMTLYRQVMASERPTPARFGLDVGDWEPVLARALAPHPAERYPSAGAFLQALTEALPGAAHRRRVSSATVSHAPPPRDPTVPPPRVAPSSTAPQAIEAPAALEPAAPPHRNVALVAGGVAAVVLASVLAVRAMLAGPPPAPSRPTAQATADASPTPVAPTPVAPTPVAPTVDVPPAADATPPSSTAPTTPVGAESAASDAGASPGARNARVPDRDRIRRPRAVQDGGRSAPPIPDLGDGEFRVQ